MTTTLNHYPTIAQIRALIDADELAALVADVSDYHRTETVAEYHGEVTPVILAAWAEFANTVTLHQYTDAIVTRDFKITRKLTQTELEDVALAKQQSDRYYHPENYPLDYAYDDESGKYVLATEIKEN